MDNSITQRITSLSAFTEDDNSFLKKLANQAANTVVGRLSGNLSNVSIEPVDNDYRNALRTAAFLGSFDPLRVMPSAKESSLKKLLSVCTVSTDGTLSRWMLRADDRARVLNEVASDSGGLAQGIKNARKYLESVSEHADTITLTLLKFLGGSSPQNEDFASMSKEVLAATRAVLGWLQPVEHELSFNLNGLLADIELTELLEPFRFLTGYDSETSRDVFVGRETELRQLRTFVDVLDSKSLFESAHRGLRRMISSDRRVLCLSGVGGIGKSTLLAKFILQHVDNEYDHESVLRFSYLDFDRSTLSAAQPCTLLIEMIRQLGWQLPKLRKEFDELRNRIREEMELSKYRVAESSSFNNRLKDRHLTAEGTSTIIVDKLELTPELIGPSMMNKFLFEAGQIISKGHNNKALLLVLDTFEEAQMLGDQAVSRIETFIEAAQENLAGLRVVISGRDEVSGFFHEAERLAITEFSDDASRVAFLERRGLDIKTAKKATSYLGGRPLTLLLAARLIKEQGLNAVSVSLTDRFKGVFNRYLIDGILYQRILDHIEDKDVRRLAHPGLVLRRIDSDVIQSVIAPVLGLGELSEEKANRILAAFRLQKDLIRCEPDGSVTHRPDVREQMLELMSMEKPEMVRNLHETAASYYAARQIDNRYIETRDRDCIEEIYHRLSIGDSLERITQLWSSKVRLGLAKSVDEISNLAGRGTLKVLLGRVPTSEELNALPIDINREYIIKSLSSAMAANNAEKAYDILRQHAELLPTTLIRSIEPRVLDRIGQWSNAYGLFTELVEKWGRQLPLSDVLAAADFFERNDRCNRQREILADILNTQGDQFINRKERDLWLLAALRLQIRQGEYGKNRVSLNNIKLSRSNSLMATFTAPSINRMWFLMLTDEIERHGPRVLESMQVNNSVRDKLTYLIRLLEADQQSKESAIGIKFCNELSQVRTLGMLSQQFWIKESAGQRVESLILRHLVRPSTPQWYIPFACLLRRELGEAVRVYDVYNNWLPELPFKASATLKSTKSLADFLGQLDQLGVLHICLQHLPISRRKSNYEFETILNDYLEWRNAMFFDVDAWFGSFERIRQLSNTGRQYK